MSKVKTLSLKLLLEEGWCKGSIFSHHNEIRVRRRDVECEEWHMHTALYLTKTLPAGSLHQQMFFKQQGTNCFYLLSTAWVTHMSVLWSISTQTRGRTRGYSQQFTAHLQIVLGYSNVTIDATISSHSEKKSQKVSLHTPWVMLVCSYSLILITMW